MDPISSPLELPQEDQSPPGASLHQVLPFTTASLAIGKHPSSYLSTPPPPPPAPMFPTIAATQPIPIITTSRATRRRVPRAVFLGAVAGLLLVASVGMWLALRPHHSSAVPLYSYVAAAPGACDQGGGQWEPTSMLNITLAPLGDAVITQCTPDGLRLTETAATGTYQLTGPRFWLHGRPFPSHYRLAVTLDLAEANGGCAGLAIEARSTGAGSAAVALVCANGTWALIATTPSPGVSVVVDSGAIAIAAAYDLRVTVNQGTISLQVNGQAVSTQALKSGQPAQSTPALCFLPFNEDGSAIYRNFIYTAFS